jgi:hypothetical protein
MLHENDSHFLYPFASAGTPAQQGELHLKVGHVPMSIQLSTL